MTGYTPPFRVVDEEQLQQSSSIAKLLFKLGDVVIWEGCRHYGRTRAWAAGKITHLGFGVRRIRVADSRDPVTGQHIIEELERIPAAQVTTFDLPDRLGLLPEPVVVPFALLTKSGSTRKFPADSPVHPDHTVKFTLPNLKSQPVFVCEQCGVTFKFDYPVPEMFSMSEL